MAGFRLITACREITMTGRWQWILGLVTRRLWFRAAIYGMVAILASLAAAMTPPIMPQELASRVGADSIEDILKILASSMLAVATFSIGTMVAAFAAASSAATPRASKLLVEDTTSHNVLSTFIGAFIFGLIGFIALRTGIYGPSGRVILFVVTLFVITAVLLTFFRWIDYLSNLGRLSETIERVEVATKEAMLKRRENFFLQCAPLQAVPSSALPLFSDKIGYVQYLDVAALAECAKRAHGDVYIDQIPGAFADQTTPLAWTSWRPDDEELGKLLKAFLVGNSRSFEQDPRFGLIVLSEIASRALSPAVNDPGTAIDVVGRVVRILSLWTHNPAIGKKKILYPNVHVPCITVADLFEDVFAPLARDAAATLEVSVRLQKGFKVLYRMSPDYFGKAARWHSRRALEYSLAKLTLKEDQHVLESLASDIGP